MIDHGDPSIPQLAVHVTETVEVGPIPVFFSNQNLAMGLKSHSHHAEVRLVFETVNGGHGYPSFGATNDALRAWVQQLTSRGLFRDATNEDVVRRIYAWVDSIDFTDDAPWAEWGGEYRLQSVILDVHSNRDKIGHDDGITRYTVTRHPLNDYPGRYVVGADLAPEVVSRETVLDNLGMATNTNTGWSTAVDGQVLADRAARGELPGQKYVAGITIDKPGTYPLAGGGTITINSPKEI